MLTVGTCLAWSAVTVAMGSAHSYDELLIGRAFLGLSMAVTAPAAFSLIADLTPPARIATANSVYSGMVPSAFLCWKKGWDWTHEREVSSPQYQTYQCYV